MKKILMIGITAPLLLTGCFTVRETTEDTVVEVIDTEVPNTVTYEVVEDVLPGWDIVRGTDGIYDYGPEMLGIMQAEYPDKTNTYIQAQDEKSIYLKQDPLAWTLDGKEIELRNHLEPWTFKSLFDNKFPNDTGSSSISFPMNLNYDIIGIHYTHNLWSENELVVEMYIISYSYDSVSIY